MPVPQLPIELIKLIVADPVLTKADLQSLSLTARAFPPLVRPHLFERLKKRLAWISEDSEPRKMWPYHRTDRALAPREMDRLMSFRLHPDLAALVNVVVCGDDGSIELQPPPGSLRMAACDLVQLMYTVFPRLEGAASEWGDRPMAPPHLPIPCCQTLRSLQGLSLDTQMWSNLQMCTALRELGIEEIFFEVDAVPPSLPFRLETLKLGKLSRHDRHNDFVRPFLRACGPTLKHLWLGRHYDDVPYFSILPSLVSLGVEMTDGIVGVWGESLGHWFTTALPTCVTLKRLTISTNSKNRNLLRTTPLGMLALPRVAAALPATLKRIDFNMALEEGELEAVLSNQSSVQVISAYLMFVGLLPQARYQGS
ncbi:hypothetical protein RHOSPDRAFT_32803 [Rhodotorula sp. JG-1b]|nr:hypothetical protein RHOSPDRAFT_32803 [Rhodotorula sp. JG-1b]